MPSFMVVLASVFLLVSCPGCSGGNQNEAEKAAMQEISKYVVKCGDIYCCKNFAGYFNQYKELFVSIKDTTSKADQLNGFECTYLLNVSLGEARRNFEDNRWSKWESIDRDDWFTVLARKKKSGQWETEINGLYIPQTLTCSDVPK